MFSAVFWNLQTVPFPPTLHWNSASPSSPKTQLNAATAVNSARICSNNKQEILPGDCFWPLSDSTFKPPLFLPHEQFIHGIMHDTNINKMREHGFCGTSALIKHLRKTQPTQTNSGPAGTSQKQTFKYK